MHSFASGTMDKKQHFPNEVASSTSTSDDSVPKIYKLNINCFETIFDYLSLEELSACSQTCKLMQKVAGHILRTKYPFLRVFIDEFGDILTDRLGLQVNLNNLREYIAPISFVNDINTTISAEQCEQFKSVKYVCFSGTIFTGSEIETVKAILEKVNAVDLMSCGYERIGLIQRLLELCVNLKHFAIRSSLDYNDTAWLLQKYPKLEHLALLPLTNEEINELSTFFQLNPNIRNFIVDSDFLWLNRVELMQIKLEELFIYLSNDFCYEYNDAKLNEYFGVLNEWYANGVYKRLHIIGELNQEIIDKLVTVNGLVGFKSTALSMDADFTTLINLEILYIDHFTNDDVDVTPIAEKLKNLKEVGFLDADYSTILPFIKHLPKLKRIMCKYMDTDENINELLAFNRERRKLDELVGNVSKVAIYIPEAAYLDIRNKSVTMYLDLVEIRPFEQYDMDLFYSY